jgi:uncharacterized membrane protein YciS (DUF1049 family)
MFLLQIFNIEFDLAALISFVIGVSFGMLVLVLVYMYAVLRTLRQSTQIKHAEEEDIDQIEIKLLIQDAQKQFSSKQKRNQIGYTEYLFAISKDLALDIAHKFYPTSKTPYLELTLDETLLLNHYITTRVETLMDHAILKLFRKMTLSSVYQLTQTTQKVANSKVIKTAQKYGLDEVAKASISAINIMNPVYWIKKVTTTQILDRILVKIGMAIIAITGEETYKIYSKKVFMKDLDLTSDVDALYESIENDLKEQKV